MSESAENIDKNFEKVISNFVDESDISMIKEGVWSMKYPNSLRGIYVDLPRGAFLGGGGGREVYSTTNIGNDGEDFVNEFALTAGVKAELKIPSSGRAAQRKVTMFKRDKLAKKQETKKQPSEEQGNL